eukprot:g23761.t1
MHIFTEHTVLPHLPLTLNQANEDDTRRPLVYQGSARGYFTRLGTAVQTTEWIRQQSTLSYPNFSERRQPRIVLQLEQTIAFILKPPLTSRS